MSKHLFQVHNYDLAATLGCGQAFRWDWIDGGWEGIVGSRWIRLQQGKRDISVEISPIEPGSTQNAATEDLGWLRDYLQIDADFEFMVSTFPDDEPMRQSVAACRGLRLLKQEPWECLASFILSSTKQIVQIRQIIAQLCETFGEPLPTPKGRKPAFSFPTAERIAACTEAELRACKMGFRAPYLLGSAQKVVSGEIHLQKLGDLPLEKARAELMALPGVGRKIADCVLLFGYGFPQAFPIDVWVLKALRQLYFPKRTVKLKRLVKFSETYFGPYSGCAQQYLFHYMRTKNKPAALSEK